MTLEIPLGKPVVYVHGELILDEFKSLLRNVIDNNAPLKEKKIRGKDNPWLTSSIKQKINTRDYHLRKARRMRKLTGLHTNVNAIM